MVSTGASQREYCGYIFHVEIVEGWTFIVQELQIPPPRALVCPHQRVKAGQDLLTVAFGAVARMKTAKSRPDINVR